MTSYQKSSLSWQLQVLSQNVREWLDWQRDRLWGQMPEITPPRIDNWSWWEGVLLHGLLWLVIALAIAFIGLNRKTWQQYWLQLQGQSAGISTALPTPSTQQWGKLAQQSAQHKDYAQACRYLYLATLQTLDDRQLIAQTPARTDRE